MEKTLLKSSYINTDIGKSIILMSLNSIHVLSKIGQSVYYVIKIIKLVQFPT